MTLIDGIAAPLAAALAAKGYETLTPVQEAALAEGCEGRDLLVSAQTGSGKTVAFGLAIAPELLAEGLELAVAPRALIVAPTRELALQVRRELEWLYAGTGARVASCVGGMDYRTEKRALERGAAIVVGTPGRLRDHIERRSLDLSALRAAVLDEADEMLDLGFQEDLEFILAAAPADRRTLMFSATVPRSIEKLAQDYQRDALRVIARGEARQHGDIEYRAISVALRDRENAVLNLLRLHEARVAIVFCKTRAAVSHLLARMGNRGFQVVALSGELSQQERSHALQALRDGRARVCIATDVAARGIDLPGLDLVVHFDLPSNSETLLHRSGRTGRAGQKGVSVLVVTPSDYRKAQRLLAGAKVTADWGKPPSADEVRAADDARLMENEAFGAPDEDEADMVAALLARHGAEAVAAAALRLWRAGRSAPEELHDIPAPGAPAPRPARTGFAESVWFAIPVGRSGRAEARWLLPKLCEHGGITKDAIGAIRVQEDETFVQIDASAAAGFTAALGPDLALDEGLSLRRLPAEPVLERNPRPGPERDRKPRAPRGDTPRPPRRERDGPTEERPARRMRDEAMPERPAPRQPRVDAVAERPAEAPRPARVATPAPDGEAGHKPRKPRAKPGAERPARVEPARNAAPGDKPFRRPADRGDSAGDRSGDRPARKPFAGKPSGGKPVGKGGFSGGQARPTRPKVGPKPGPKPGLKSGPRGTRPAPARPDFSDPGVSLRGRPRPPSRKG